jgi:hypothetical protein
VSLAERTAEPLGAWLRPPVARLKLPIDLQGKAEEEISAEGRMKPLALSSLYRRCYAS